LKLITIFNIKKKIKFILVFFLLIFILSNYFIKPWDNSVDLTAAPIYQGNAKEKIIALTFNVVWGEEYIPQIMESLEENDVQATFFIGGQWAENFPELVREIARAGHGIGNHGYSHPHPDRISLAANINEIKQAENVITGITGTKPVLFAPPYGERGDVVLKAAEETGYKTILWSIDTIDWQRPDPSIILNRVLTNAHNGAIVLMHPTAPTVHALPQIVTELKKQGFELVKVSIMLAGLKTKSLP
jgi:probable sporulation protein (polysaccharide deacetylase family)